MLDSEQFQALGLGGVLVVYIVDRLFERGIVKSRAKDNSVGNCNSFGSTRFGSGILDKLNSIISTTNRTGTQVDEIRKTLDSHVEETRGSAQRRDHHE